MQPLLGAILVGGRSTRMGRDKATLTMPGGQTMLEAVATALRSACSTSQIVLVGKRQSERTAIDSRFFHIQDHREAAGPLAGIESLLTSNLAREYLVCPCDVPYISANALTALLNHRDAPATVIRVAGRAQFEPLPARISTAALGEVRSLLDAEERSVWRLMERLPAAIVDVDAAIAPTLRNINTPDDFNTL